jgi:hypothetical protein
MQPPFIIRPINKGQVITSAHLSKLSGSLNRMNAGAASLAQIFTPINLQKQKIIRILTLLNAPGIQYKTGVPHQPYSLPNNLQSFHAANLRFYFTVMTASGAWTAPELQCLFNLYSLDAAGVDIEHVVIDGLLFPDATTYISGYVQGNKWWSNGNLWNRTSNTGRAITAPVFICGWRSTVTLNYGTGTITLPPSIKGIFTGMV